jgi:RimJ/RimL family protein N-acetyltransferase
MNPSITLRRAQGTDAEVFHAIRLEPSASQYQPLRPYPLERLRSMLEQRASAPLDRNLEGKVQWVIEIEGEPAGWISLDVTSREHGVGSVGYTVSERFRGHGIATEAVKLVTAIAFDPGQVDLARLEAIAAVNNLASRRVLVKAGFREEGIAGGLLVIGGERVDHVRFGLLRVDGPPITGDEDQAR